MGKLLVNGNIESHSANHGCTLSMANGSNIIMTLPNYNGGWASGHYFDVNNTRLGGFGVYGTHEKAYYFFAGASYSSPWMSVTPDGTVTATKFVGSLQGNADTVDNYHFVEGGNAYKYKNEFTQPTANTTWYLKISTPQWNAYQEVICIQATGNNAYGTTIIRTGARHAYWWGYASSYNFTGVDGIKKVVSNSDDVYIQLNPRATSITIYTTFSPTITSTTDTSDYTTVPSDGGLFGNVFTATTFIGNLRGNADTATSASAAPWSGITGKPSHYPVRQGRSEASNYRALLMHYTNTSYGEDPGFADAHVYYNETIAACPDTGAIKATTFIGSLDGNATSASRLSYHSALQTTESIDNFLEADKLKAAIWKNTQVTGLVSNGIIVSIGWENTAYGAQLAIDDDPTYFIALRQKNSSGWSEWKKIPMADGTGASGTWGISISGNAATSSRLLNKYNISGDSHSLALKAAFDTYKNSTPKDEFLTYYSSAYGNGSMYMGYFISGYDSTPYGGFYVAHYDTPYYVGIQYGSYNQQTILTSSNYATWCAPASHTHSYLPLSGGTMTGTIITPGNDSVVIRPALNNYDQIGASDYKFWKIYATTFYGNLSGNADTATTATTANSVAWGNVSGKPSTFTPSSHGHSSLSDLIVDDNLAYNTIGTDSGGGPTYDKALLSTLCQRYPNYDGNFSGRYWPNAYGFLLGNIYNTSITSGGLPQYSTFIGSNLADANPRIFGTHSYNYYSYTLLTSGNYSSYALPLSGGTLTGTLQVNAPIFGYNYTNSNNAAAFIWDKNGGNYTGVGSCNTTDMIHFGPCSASGAWVSNYNQIWRFQGGVYAAGWLETDNYGTGDPGTGTPGYGRGGAIYFKVIG